MKCEINKQQTNFVPNERKILHLLFWMFLLSQFKTKIQSFQQANIA